MAEPVYSTWQITFNPGTSGLVLVGFGSILESEPVFEGVNPVELVQLASSTWSYLRDVGNCYTRITFTVYSFFFADSSAKAAALLASAAAGTGKKPLKIEFAGTFTRYQYLYAVIESAKSTIIPTPTSTRVAVTYTITATNLATA